MLDCSGPNVGSGKWELLTLEQAGKDTMVPGMGW